MNPEIEDAKPAVDAFELPCGYLDDDGNLHVMAEVVEMTGEEEEILAAKNMPVVRKLNRILANCVKAIGSIRGRGPMEKAIPDLTQGDRLFLMFAIRRVSLGDEIPFVAKCPSCEQECKLSVFLNELETKKMPDPRLRTYGTVLPKTGKKVQMKVLTGKGEEVIAKAAQNGKDIISAAILARIDNIEGRPATIEDLKALPLKDRNHLKGIWEDYEGGVDTDLDVTCPHCEHEFKAPVEVGGQGFFNPSAMLKAWNKKSST